MGEAAIDSCCLINLCAVGRLEEWLPGLGFSWHVSGAVMKEVLYLRTWDEEGGRQKEEIDLGALMDQGVLASCDITPGAELALYVQLAAQVDDGEAMGLAIAKTRGWRLATDDKPALRLAAEMDVTSMTTPEIMHSWAGTGMARPGKVATALRRIEKHARYRPPDDHTLANWWVRARCG